MIFCLCASLYFAVFLAACNYLAISYSFLRKMHCFYLFLSLSLMSWIILAIAMFSHVVSVAFLSVLSLVLVFFVRSASPAMKIFTHGSTSSANTIKRFFETNWFQLFRVFEHSSKEIIRLPGLLG